MWLICGEYTVNNGEYMVDNGTCMVHNGFPWGTPSSLDGLSRKIHL